jgi:hypothetical protein
MRLSLHFTVLISLITMTFSGCFLPQDNDDDFEPPPPPAAAQFVHQNPEMGAVEVLFDGGVVTTVAYGSVSPAVALPQGEGAFSFRLSGAPSAFFETELYNLEARVYTFALVAESLMSDKVLDLTDATPAPEEGQHWLRFLNLSDVDSGTLFRGTDQLIDLPLDDNPSAFIAVESATATQVSLSATNGAPLAIETGIELPSGGSSILILSGSQEGNVAIQAIVLDAERLTLVEPGAEVMTEE